MFGQKHPQLKADKIRMIRLCAGLPSQCTGGKLPNIPIRVCEPTPRLQSQIARSENNPTPEKSGIPERIFHIVRFHAARNP